MINRLVSLPGKQSFFLLGPRQTGKSTLIQRVFTLKGLWKVDLLLTENFFKYSKEPGLFRAEAEEKIRSEGVRRIFVDEIQRVPLLLNEIQHLMDHHPCQFILTGSSARKLKREAANLLAGRALQRFLHPFVYDEIKKDFSLSDALLFGTLPPLLGKTKQEKIDILSAYANTYLREEIQSEGLVRNLGGFSRFLDLAASQSGEILSFSAIARECHLPVRTVQSYYEILEDTLLGFRLASWQKSLRKRLVGHPKFYLFDLGVVNALNKRLTASPDLNLRGKLFEQFIILETRRLLQYFQSEASLFYWRTNHGAEVDLLIEKHGKIVGAFEIKGTANVASAHLTGLRSFRQEHKTTPLALVSLVENTYQIEGIKILPWPAYLRQLHEIL